MFIMNTVDLMFIHEGKFLHKKSEDELSSVIHYSLYWSVLCTSDGREIRILPYNSRDSRKPNNDGIVI